MTWSVTWARTPWSTSCCRCPSALLRGRIWSAWWPTLTTRSCTPGPPSRWRSRTRRCRSPCGMRTGRGWCSPRRRCGSPGRTAWACGPCPTAPTAASSTAPPSSSTSPCPPSPTDCPTLLPAPAGNHRSSKGAVLLSPPRRLPLQLHCSNSRGGSVALRTCYHLLYLLHWNSHFPQYVLKTSRNPCSQSSKQGAASTESNWRKWTHNFKWSMYFKGC